MTRQPVGVFLSEDATRDRERLDATQDKKLLWLAKQLRRDVTYGDQVQGKLIPKQLQRTYACTNLWRVELPGGWRVLYTIMTRPDEGVTVSVLRILDHRDYDRLFGYSTS